jgi:hypothetical protein
MPLYVPEADLVEVTDNVVDVEVTNNGVDGAAPRRVDAQSLKFDLMIMQVLHRDDPWRLYIQRRWHGHPTPVPFSLEVAGYNFEGQSLSPIALSRR